MSLLATHLDPQAAPGSQQALGVCVETLKCLERRRLPWLGLFRLPEAGGCLGRVLLRLAPDPLLRLLPVAFYRLMPHIDHDAPVGEDAFLAWACSEGALRGPSSCPPESCPTFPQDPWGIRSEQARPERAPR
ncbi:PREDICTED: Fanconi anemia group A protein [Condylura cristata]|uniref:Fanconi anemia group A protein n=1 Tax=Condylura cristata TaxID=143302 RepID=UPI0006436008|nr:PREDICTED: Fanconi anemia group A protein [Condylura cristata]